MNKWQTTHAAPGQWQGRFNDDPSGKGNGRDQYSIHPSAIGGRGSRQRRKRERAA